MADARRAAHCTVLLIFACLGLSACTGADYGYGYGPGYADYGPAYGGFVGEYGLDGGGWDGWHHGWDHSGWQSGGPGHGLARSGFQGQSGFGGHGCRADAQCA